MSALPAQSPPRPPGPARLSARSPRRWRDKFAVAVRGLKLGIRGHSSFFVHFFFAALVAAAAVVLRCHLVEWCILLGCVAMVFVAELFNSAIETLFRGFDEATKSRVWPALDVAAGAVLMASIFASVIGSAVFLNRLAVLVGYAAP